MWCKEHRGRNTGNTEIKEIQNIKLIYYEGGQTFEQVVQWGCRVAIPGDTQNPTQHSPEQSAPADSALSRKVGLDLFQR